MLSISNVSAEQAGNYYTRGDNYYTKAEGLWYGKGAALLGLSGPVEKADFEALLNGKDLAGNELVQAASNGEHRAGIDLTFSAPKSVSILSEVLGIKEVREAHEKAVSAVLLYAEQNHAQCRMTQGGKTERTNTGNLVIARFAHDTSRELDPQTHSHAVVLNVVQDLNGKWKALSNEKLYDNKMLLGQLYRTELAANLKDLGYAIEADSRGFFEIGGIDKDLLDHFSRRSEQTETAAKVLKEQYPEAPESKLREMACLSSREAKKSVDPQAVREAWSERLERQGHSKDTILASVREAGEKIKIAEAERAEPRPTEYDYISFATAAITEQESTFSREDVLKTAARMSTGEVRFADLEQAFINSGHLKRLGKDEAGQDVYTTREMQKTEREIVQTARDGQNTLQPILSAEQVTNVISHKYQQLTEGQKQAVEHILTCTDKIIGVQGIAGAGKTTMATAVQEQLAAQGYRVRGLGFTGKSAMELGQVGIKSQTLHLFLGQFDPKKLDTAPDPKKHQEALKHFSAPDLEAVKQGASPQDIEKAVGPKSFILNTKTSLRAKGGMKVSQERYLDAIKRNVKDTLKNEWYKIASTINPLGVNREKNQVQDVYFRDADGNISRGRQVSHWHVSERGRHQEYESFTLMGNGDILHTKHTSHAVFSSHGFGVSTDVSEIIRNPSHHVQRGKEVWLVDESSMVGSRQMHQLLKAAQKAEARVVFTGDMKQLQAISAGRMFVEMQKSGAMKTVEMPETVRQKDVAYKEIVEDMAEKRIKEAFSKLHKAGKIREIGKDGDRQEAIVTDYTRRKDYRNVLVVTALNKDRNALNAAIRDRLKDQGRLKGEEAEFVVRESRATGPVEQHFIDSYATGDIVIANGPRTGIKVGAEGRVVNVDRNRKTITLDVKGKQKEIDIRQHGRDLMVYREKVQKFSEGEKVVFLKNSKKLGVMNGMTGQVVSLDAKGMTVETDGGKEVYVNMADRYNYVDHGYAVTTYKSQGQTSREVIFHGEAPRDPEQQKWQSYNSVYVAMSRGKESITIYTDDAAKLEQAARIEQQKTSTLDYPDKGISETEKAQMEAIKKTQKEGGEVAKGHSGKDMESGTKDRVDSAAPERAENGETERSHKAENERQKDIEIER